MQIGELRESEKPLRCAYCHTAVDADPVVCPDCGTRLHSECIGSLQSCPTLGCTSRLPGQRLLDHPVRGPFPLVRTVAGALLIATAVAFLHRSMMRVDAAQGLVAGTVFGVPGLLLVVPALRRLLGGSLVIHAVMALVTIFLALPALIILYSPFENTLTIERVGWFSYSMTWVAGGEGMVEHTYLSTHTLLLTVAAVHICARLLSRSHTAGTAAPEHAA